MKTRTFVAAGVLILAMFLLGQHRHAQATDSAGFHSVVDLSHSINAKVPAFDPPGTPLFTATVAGTLEKDGYFARNISVPEHFGTHIDAPAHFVRGMWTVDQIPPERLVAPLVVLDVSANAKGNPDYLITVADIAQWERANGQIPPGAVVMARTGWDTRWNSAAGFRNADAKGTMHFPGYSLEAAKFLVEARDIFGLGIDTLSIDNGPSSDFPVHHYVLAHSVYQLEDVANLDRVPPTGAVVVVAPMKLEGGSGSPVRLLALVK